MMAVLSETYGVTTLRKDRADLPLLQRMLDDGVFSVEQTIELQSMGIVFGDVLVKELGLQWRMISDEYGTDPTVTIPEISDGVVCFNTLTMISKRIEEGREVDVNRLFEVVEAEVKRSRSEGEDKDKRESLSRS
ncbi:MAG: DUF3806 domain-containing protein [Sedimentisphaerales bacterium]|nr:DUF3806 domain-containing protein [Sedimentisphaerales bacterium]